MTPASDQRNQGDPGLSPGSPSHFAMKLRILAALSIFAVPLVFVTTAGAVTDPCPDGPAYLLAGVSSPICVYGGGSLLQFNSYTDSAGVLVFQTESQTLAYLVTHLVGSTQVSSKAIMLGLPPTTFDVPLDAVLFGIVGSGWSVTFTPPLPPIPDWFSGQLTLYQSDPPVVSVGGGLSELTSDLVYIAPGLITLAGASALVLLMYRYVRRIRF